MKRLNLLFFFVVFSSVLLAQHEGSYLKQTVSMNGDEVTVYIPSQNAEGNPWVLNLDDGLSAVDSVLLKKGFHVVCCDNFCYVRIDKAIRQIDDLYKYMCTRYQLSVQPAFEGCDEKGDFIFDWAAANRDKVSCIYFHHVEEMQNIEKSLATLSLAEIPIVGRGSLDNESLLTMLESYQAMGGVMEIVGDEIDRDDKRLTGTAAVTDFILRNRQEYKHSQYITCRTGLKNAFYRFRKEKVGTVAFLGGSITEMKGWRNMIKAELQYRFPGTDFNFIEVGIGSTGSTPHAFRFEKDVLAQGIPDLLFVEAAVNDHTNGFGPVEQVRGMEGIVRHARLVNPNMDIVMLHFIYAPFIKAMQQGVLPDVVMNHERVANYYNLPSINLVQEIVARMDNNEFTWKDFGGTHPAWEGHKYYAASICRLFDMNMCADTDLKLLPHPLPQKPLDEFSYENGHFMDVREAKVLDGFHYVENWVPGDTNVGRRKGFVNVPMLEATRAGASLELDFVGKAIGIFCVAGPRAGIVEYSVDGTPYKRLNTYTVWSKDVYLPWVYMLEDELNEGEHTLRLRIADGKNAECQIRNFVVNGLENMKLK